MKKLSSLSLFVALAGLALISTADSFAERFPQECLCSQDPTQQGKWDNVSPMNENNFSDRKAGEQACHKLCLKQNYKASRVRWEADEWSQSDREYRELLQKKEGNDKGSYEQSCEKCQETKISEHNKRVTCGACRKKDSYPVTPLFLANRGETSVECHYASKVNNCDGKLKCGSCPANP